MSIRTLTSPLRLVAVQYRRRMKGGKTAPRLVVAHDEDRQRKSIVLKLRCPGTLVGNGHYAGTSLACELICSVLARAVGLNVPDYAIVEVTQRFINSIDDNSIRDLLSKNIGPNFGSVYHQSLTSWEARYHKRSQVVINQLEDILTFDAVVINGDRQISNSNLLHRGNQLLLIDHSLALPVYLWEQQELTKSPLFPLGSIMKHCASQHLKGSDGSYRRVLDNWQEKINTQKLSELRAMLPPSWERQQGDIDKIFGFLNNRDQRFSDISTCLMRVLS